MTYAEIALFSMLLALGIYMTKINQDNTELQAKYNGCRLQLGETIAE